MNQIFLPPENRPLELARELQAFFQPFAFVHRILAFGSIGRGACDRWSDVDLLVVCAGGPPAYWRLFEQLREKKPAIHRGKFWPRVEPAGSAILGIVFEDESIFSILDLNFLSPDEFAQEHFRQRFGLLKELYCSDSPQDFATEQNLAGRVILDEEEDAVEMEIWAAMHFTNKSIKRYLRDQCPVESIQPHANRLREVLGQYPGYQTARGDIHRVAQSFLDFALTLLHA